MGSEYKGTVYIFSYLISVEEANFLIMYDGKMY